MNALAKPTIGAVRRQSGRPIPAASPVAIVGQPATVAECPGCGCDVHYCIESVGADGKRRWKQPVGSYTSDDGLKTFWTGGLVHVEGGARCTADAEAGR